MTLLQLYTYIHERYPISAIRFSHRPAHVKCVDAQQHCVDT